MIKWPGLYMPPINLWSVPRLENEMSDWAGTPEQEIETLRKMVEQRDAEIERLRGRVALYDKALMDAASQADLAASMMDSDKRGQIIADAFIAIRDFATRSIDRICTQAAEKGGDDEKASF